MIQSKEDSSKGNSHEQRNCVPKNDTEFILIWSCTIAGIAIGATITFLIMYL